MAEIGEGHIEQFTFEEDEFTIYTPPDGGMWKVTLTNAVNEHSSTANDELNVAPETGQETESGYHSSSTEAGAPRIGGNHMTGDDSIGSYGMQPVLINNDNGLYMSNTSGTGNTIYVTVNLVKVSE